MSVWSGDQRASEPDAQSGPGPAGDRRAAAAAPILVVDDDPSILETVRAILESEGYHVVTATNGREALDAAARVTPFLMLLDMRMPVLDGWGVAAALGAGPRRFPVVVMTATENAKRWADEIGADGHLAKPFDLSDLLRCVARHERRTRPH